MDRAATLVAPPQISRAAGAHHHSKRSQAFYCYPKNYWWFYRPYTTAQQDFPRCMPYFHYLDPPYARGARSDRYGK